MLVLHCWMPTCTGTPVACIHWRPLLSDTDRFCAHGQKPVQTGMVDRHGQQKTCLWALLCDLKRIQFFRHFWLFGCAYRLLGCRDVKIWWFCANRWQTKPIALPRAHAHRVNILLYYCHYIKIIVVCLSVRYGRSTEMIWPQDTRVKVKVILCNTLSLIFCSNKC